MWSSSAAGRGQRSQCKQSKPTTDSYFVAPPPLTWALIGALLLHPAVVGGAVSIAGQSDGGARDADAGLSVLVVPDPAP